jgi:hypothetical protein
MRKGKFPSHKETESSIRFIDGTSNHLSPSLRTEASLGLGLLGRNNDIGTNSALERPPNGRPSLRRSLRPIDLPLADLR